MTKKIFKSIMLVSALATALGLAFVMAILYQYFGRQIDSELQKEAVFLSYGVEEKGVEYLEGISDNSSRITYIDENGEVLYDSEADTDSMENHAHREEVQAAFQQGSGKSQRYSRTLSEKTIYYAMRLNDGKVLRVSNTQSSVLSLLKEMVLPVLWILLLIIVLSGIFASRVSKRIVEPINSLDLEHPEENQSYEEVEPLLSRIYKQKREITNQLEMARQQQEEFAIITENMQEGLLLIDRYTMILSGNASVWRLFKVKKPKTGESVFSLNRSEDFRNVISDAIQGRHRDELLKLEGCNIQIIANPVIRDGVTEGAVILLVNVTEKTERENLRREFSANVSHELKTPLTSISGFAEIIQDGFVKEEDVKTFAGRIYKEAQRLIQLVDDVMRISRLDESSAPCEWETVDLYQAVKEVFEQLSKNAEARDIHLYIEGDRPKLETVKQILTEILFNLCDNAIKYNKPHGDVCFRMEEHKECVKILVRDTGIGIPREDQERVFERFYRVDKSHSKDIGGTGLGLSIVKHGVLFLGGQVELQSEPNRGTEITVTLPRC